MYITQKSQTVLQDLFENLHSSVFIPSFPTLPQPSSSKHVSFPYLYRQLSLIILNDLRDMVFTSLSLNSMLIFLSLSLFFLLSFRNHVLILTMENENLVFHTHFPSPSLFIHISHLSLFT